jgi:hypothetical protein
MLSPFLVSHLSSPPAHPPTHSGIPVLALPYTVCPVTVFWVIFSVWLFFFSYYIVIIEKEAGMVCPMYLFTLPPKYTGNQMERLGPVCGENNTNEVVFWAPWALHMHTCALTHTPHTHTGTHTGAQIKYIF